MAGDAKAPEAVERLAAKLGRPRAMRRASLSERWMKCTKEACACASDEQARHGPYYSVTWAEAGKTRSRLVSAAQLSVVREQIEADREFRRDVAAYRLASQHWADTQLAEILQEAAPDKAAKKGGSRRRSRGKSPLKSRRL